MLQIVSQRYNRNENDGDGYKYRLCWVVRRTCFISNTIIIAYLTQIHGDGNNLPCSANFSSISQIKDEILMRSAGELFFFFYRLSAKFMLLPIDVQSIRFNLSMASSKRTCITYIIDVNLSSAGPRGTGNELLMLEDPGELFFSILLGTMLNHSDCWTHLIRAI